MRRQSSYPMSLKALMVMALCVMTTYAAHAVVVDFLDKNLEAAIRKAIHKPTGDILQTDLVGRGFKQFDAGNCGITDLKGIEYCTDLEGLGLAKNQISDISALVDLTNAYLLFLSENQIRDVSPLAALTNLQYLLLDANQISDISALANLTRLHWLQLNNNQISDISVLTNLTRLSHLELDGNEIRGIGSRVALARIECRKVWRNLGSTKWAVLVGGLTLFVVVFVKLRLWARRVSKRYTREP